MNESLLHHYLTLGEIGLAIPTLVFLIWIAAPYGRHARGGWGPQIPARLGWILMELPAVLLWLGIFLSGRHRWELVPWIFLAIWQTHYIHRTFIFPFRLRPGSKAMPVSVALMGMGFQALNAYVNARWVSHFGHYSTQWLADPRFILGLGLFVIGLGINLHSDTVLLGLRKPGDTSYRIPRGGLFRWVTCPNYLGEILEWIGWAILTWSLSGLAFAVYTIANLAPRALAHHRWYREKFADYPRTRRALIPYIL